jgi:hypothetical protein
MKDKGQRHHLRVVQSTELDIHEPISGEDAGSLVAEATMLEAARGLNAYSSFLRKHGKRPNQKQSAVIGRLLGGQVKADDGTMQPPLSKADREAIKAIRRRRKDWAKTYSNFSRLKLAIHALAEIDESPGDLLRFCAQSELATKSQLTAAITFLERFAEEVSRYEPDARAESPSRT